MKTQISKIDSTLSVENALGIDTLDPTVGDRYAQLRAVSSENTLAKLAAQDQEYARRQGTRNLEFITGSIRHLPHLAAPTYDIENSRGHTMMGMGISRLDINRISEISLPFVITEADVEAIDGDTLAALSSIRATTVWISRPVKDVFELPSDDNYYRDRVKNKLEEDTTDVPYVITGHRLLEDGSYTEVILMPIATSSSNRRRNLQLNLDPLTVRMTTAAFTRLTSVQDGLLGSGLSPTEIKKAHDSKKGTFTIEPKSVACVRATVRKSAFGMAMSRMPSDQTDLEEDFDMQQTDTVLEQVHPGEFTSYNVLSDVQRLFAMFGALDKFETIKNELLRTSLKDPALVLLED